MVFTGMVFTFITERQDRSVREAWQETQGPAIECDFKCRYDVNKDGVLSREELRQLLIGCYTEQVPHPSTLNPERGTWKPKLKRALRPKLTRRALRPTRRALSPKLIHKSRKPEAGNGSLEAGAWTLYPEP